MGGRCARACCYWMIMATFVQCVEWNTKQWMENRNNLVYIFSVLNLGVDQYRTDVFVCYCLLGLAGFGGFQSHCILNPADLGWLCGVIHRRMNNARRWRRCQSTVWMQPQTLVVVGVFCVCSWTKGLGEGMLLHSAVEYNDWNSKNFGNWSGTHRQCKQLTRFKPALFPRIHQPNFGLSLLIHQLRKTPGANSAFGAVPTTELGSMPGFLSYCVILAYLWGSARPWGLIYIWRPVTVDRG